MTDQEIEGVTPGMEVVVVSRDTLIKVPFPLSLINSRSINNRFL